MSVRKNTGMFFPKQVKIGHQVYKVELVESIEHDVLKNENIKDPHGLCHRGHEKRIYIKSNKLSASNIADTLLHEILHAIWEESGLTSFSKSSEESVVTVVSTWLTLVMSNNPDLVKYLNNQWKVL